MEVKTSFTMKVYARSKTGNEAEQSCITQDVTPSAMKRKKRANQTSLSSSSSSSESDFDCNEEEFTCSPSPPAKKSQLKHNANPAQNRKKKLALPKAPRSARKNRTAETEIDVFDSEDDALPSYKNQGFAMLVEAALDKNEGNTILMTSAPSTRNFTSNEKDETVIGDCSSGKESENYSISEDGDDNQRENYCSVDPDGAEKPNLLQKYGKTQVPVVLEQNKMDFMKSHAKKIRSRLASQWTTSVTDTINSAKPAITIHEAKNSPELPAAESPWTEKVGNVEEPSKEPVKSVVTNIKTRCKLESASLSSKITDKSRKELAGGRQVPLGLPGTRASLKSNMESLVKNNSSGSGCSKVLQLQSSQVPHQRVVGLSRRVRPPPLHPYLSKDAK